MLKERLNGFTVLDSLRRNRLFEGAPHELVELGALYFVERSFKKGTVLFEQGDVVTGLYLIAFGKVRVNRVTSDGGGFTLEILGDTDLIGEKVIYDKKKAATTRAAAITETKLLCIARRDLMKLIAQYPVLAVNLAKYVQRKREDTIAALEDLSIRKVSERIVRLLNRLGFQHGVREPRGMRIDLRLTHAQMALLIGSARETVSVEIGALVRDKRIICADGFFIVPPASIAPVVQFSALLEAYRAES
jgi:CRP/FNR family cyclic AMP-dependent transcriptional regulator